jgi:hypothetical protein
LINSKIDPPIFEILAINSALRIMSDWEWEDASNTNKGKKFGSALNGSTRGYVNNSRR